MVTEDVFENDIEVLSDKLERLGIKKTCQVSKALLRRHDLDLKVLRRAIFDVDPSWSKEDV